MLSSGGVDCWGANRYGALGDGTTTGPTTCSVGSGPEGCDPTPVAVKGISNATAIAAGDNYTCALLAGGSIDCWGLNNSGELGDGMITDSPTPVAVSGITNATAVVAGGGHTCALLAGGSIECWGDNANGDLGDGTTGYSDVPVPVSGIP